MCAQPRRSETSRSGSEQPQTASQTITAPQPRAPAFVVQNTSDVKRLMASLGIANPGNITVLNSSAALGIVRSALGTAPVAGLLSNPPPLVVQVPDATLAKIARGRDADGFYMPNSNMLLVSASAARSPQRLNEVMYHEIAHYASWRGHGFDNVWSSGSQIARMNRPEWIEEGMANAISSSLIQNPQGRMAYPYETMAIVMLEKIAGAQVVRTAYTSGDYRPLQEAVDKKLGAGTFGRLIGFQNGAEAALFLLDAADKKPPPINMQDYFNDPRVARAQDALMPQPQARRDRDGYQFNF